MTSATGVVGVSVFSAAVLVNMPDVFKLLKSRSGASILQRPARNIIVRNARIRSPLTMRRGRRRMLISWSNNGPSRRLSIFITRRFASIPTFMCLSTIFIEERIFLGFINICFLGGN